MIKKISILILALTLSGCGFKLQGKHALSPYVKNLFVAVDNSNDSFQVQLRDVLQDNGVVLVSNQFFKNNATKKNIAILDLNTPIVSQQIHSYDSKGQVSQYRLRSECNYKLFDADGNILRQNTISRSRTYALSPNQLLSNSSEQQIISEELNMEIINELLRQLSADLNNTKKNSPSNIKEKNDNNHPC